MVLGWIDRPELAHAQLNSTFIRTANRKKKLPHEARLPIFSKINRVSVNKVFPFFVLNTELRTSQ